MIFCRWISWQSLWSCIGCGLLGLGCSSAPVSLSSSEKEKRVSGKQPFPPLFFQKESKEKKKKREGSPSQVEESLLGDGSLASGEDHLTAASGTKDETTLSQHIFHLYQDGEGLGTLEPQVVSFRARFPQSTLLPTVENFLGLAALKQKNLDLAALQFQKVSLFPSSSPLFFSSVLYHLAFVQYQKKSLKEAQQTLQRISLDVLPVSDRIRVYTLKLLVEEALGEVVAAFQSLLVVNRLLDHGGLSQDPQPFRQWLDRILQQKIQKKETLEQLLQAFEGLSFADSLLISLASLEMQLGHWGSAEAHCSLLIARHPQSSYLQKAKECILAVNQQGGVERQKIGVLLPLTGKFSRLGNRSLQAIQLALGLNRENSEGKALSLAIEDSGETLEQSLQALERLVFQHRVVAVLGPLLSKGIGPISQKAQELGVPLISLARATGPSLDYVFQAGLTQQSELEELVRYAIEERGLRKFVILMPKDGLGKELADSFWNIIEARGGEVMGFEAYEPDQTDFKQAVDRLTGLAYPEHRQAEWDALSKEREEKGIQKRTRKTEEYFKLKPIVDFDAVFIADGAKAAGQILPTFAYRDVTSVTFLGTSMWNTPEFLSRTRGYSEGATFMDLFLSEQPLESTPEEIKSWMIQYQEAYHQKPSSFEAVAYDAACILKMILGSLSDLSPSHSFSRSEMRDRLKGIASFLGITGKLNYHQGAFRRPLRAISVQKEQFIQTNFRSAGD